MESRKAHLVPEHALVLEGGVDDVRDAQVAHNLPVLGLDGAADVELALDHAVRVDGEELVAVDLGADGEGRAHEGKGGAEVLVAAGEHVQGLGLAAREFGADGVQQAVARDRAALRRLRHLRRELEGEEVGRCSRLARLLCLLCGRARARARGKEKEKEMGVNMSIFQVLAHVQK